MTALTKNKKILISLVSVFLVLSVIFILDAPNAQAGIGDYVLNGLAWIAYYILSFFSKLVTLAAYLLKSAFEIENVAHFTKAPIVTTGWEITRGLCNMIFALILLLLAFDTILQTGKFQARTILPKLVVVALLVNFSLVFCGIIIDFSQILTRYFIDAAGGTSGDIGVQLANGLNMAKVFNAPDNLTSDSELRKAFGGESASFMTIASSLIFGVIIILIAAFAIGAGAIFMVIRLVSLWILLIFAPLAWVFAIAPLPGLGGVVGDWWSKFFKWTFFAPIYAFFIYLAVLAANTAETFTQSNVGNANDSQVVGEIFTNGFLAGNGISTMLQYLVIIMILLTGLKTAQESSLKGADKVLNWGRTKGKEYAKRWTGTQWAYDVAKEKGVKLAGGAASALGFERFGRRLTARGVALETAGEAREQHKAYANNLKTMSDMDLQEEVKHTYGIRKLLAARQAKERGLLEKTDDAATVQKALATFGAYGIKDDKGKTKEQKDLEDVRFDVLDEKDQAEIIRRSKENGNIDKIKPIVAKNSTAMRSMVKELAHEFDDVFKKWGKRTKDEAKTALKENFTGPDEALMRKTYASVTGEISTAFSLNRDASGNLIEGKGTDLLKEYAQGLTSTKITDIRHANKESDLKAIGQYAKPELVNAFIRERGATAEQKIFFNQGVENNVDPAAKESLETLGGTVIQEEGKRRRSKRRR